MGDSKIGKIFHGVRIIFRKYGGNALLPQREVDAPI